MGGFYFVRVMKLRSESVLINATVVAATFWDRTGGTTASYTQLVLFSVSVLAVVTNKVKNTMCKGHASRSQSVGRLSCAYPLV